MPGSGVSNFIIPFLKGRSWTIHGLNIHMGDFRHALRMRSPSRLSGRTVQNGLLSTRSGTGLSGDLCGRRHRPSSGPFERSWPAFSRFIGSPLSQSFPTVVMAYAEPKDADIQHLLSVARVQRRLRVPRLRALLHHQHSPAVHSLYRHGGRGYGYLLHRLSQSSASFTAGFIRHKKRDALNDLLSAPRHVK